ncbi:MAG TPA: LysR family transcriptional regulator [Caulobacteraceae bacterium]|jgi:DNA-binding transcriptional LysR family regulator
MQLKTFDLNLLVVFDAVLRERSVTRAGEKLGLSQPAMSHALNRLRWLLKDQLFVRTPEGMMPTPRAEHLAEPISRALIDLQRNLDPEEFTPEEAHRRFVVAVNNYAAVVLAGPLFRACGAEAPNVSLSLRPSGTLDVPDMLDRGELDLAILGRQAPVSRFSSRTLMEDHYVAVTRRGHPMAQQRMEPAAFAALPHLVISSSGDDLGFVNAELEARGLARSIAAEAPYLSAGAILIQSDMVSVMGRQIAEEFSRVHAIELTPLPFPSPPLTSVMVWHSRFDDHPAHKWLRGAVLSAAAQF